MELSKLRKEIGGQLENVLNKLLDENFKNVGKEFLKMEITKITNGLIDKHYGGLLGGFYDKAKALVDKIDGEADVAPAPAPADATKPAAPVQG